MAGGEGGDALQIPDSGITALVPPPWERVGSLQGKVRAQQGSALKGVTLTLQALRGAKPVQAGQALSDGEGVYLFQGLVPGAYLLEVAKEGHAGERQAIWIEPGKSRAPPLRLSPSAPVAGRVVDDHGTPVKHALIRITPGQGTLGVGAQARSNARGEFLVDGLHPGQHQLRAEAQQHLPMVLARIQAPARGLQVRIMRYYQVSGRVKGAATPQNEVVVRMKGSALWPGRSVSVGKDGRFTFPRVPAGIYELVAATRRLPWMASNIASSVQVGPRSPPEVLLRLLPAQRVEGVVLHRGEPVSGAALVLGREFLAVLRHRTRTSRDGRFSLGPVITGQYRLGIWAEGYLPIIDQSLAVPAKGPLRFELSEGASLRGRVVDREGTPVPGAMVWVVYADQQAAPGQRPPQRNQGELGVVPGPVPPIPPSGAWLFSNQGQTRTRSSGKTESSGGFEIHGLWPGQARVIVDRQGYLQSRGPWMELVAGQRADLESPLVLHPASTLKGRVLDPLGKGIEAACLKITSGVSRRTVYSDRDGFFSVGGLAAQASLVVERKGYLPRSAEVAFTGELSRELDLVLEPAVGQLRGYILDPLRLPLGGVRVKASQGPLKKEGQSRPNGAFLLDGVGRERISLRIHHPGYLPYEARVDPAKEQEVRLRFAAAVQGHVQEFRTGAPIRRFTLQWKDPAGARQQKVRDPRGGFVLQGVPPGMLRLQVTAPGHATGIKVLKVREPSRPGEVCASGEVLSLRQAGAISGRVMESSGRPLKRARVSAAGVRGRTNSSGRFKLRGIPEGNHVVEVKAGGRTLRSDPVVVRAGETSGPLRIQFTPTPR